MLVIHKCVGGGGVGMARTSGVHVYVCGNTRHGKECIKWL